MMLEGSLNAVEITGDGDRLEQAYRLRVLAWRTQVRLPDDMQRWVDPVDENARHWAFLHEGRVVASVRLSLHATLASMPHPEVYEGMFAEPPTGPIAYYARAAVHPEHRRKGLFRKTHALCIGAAQSAGATCMLAVTGSVEANRFTQAVFLDAGYQHVGLGRQYRVTPYVPAYPPMVYRHSLAASAQPKESLLAGAAS